MEGAMRKPKIYSINTFGRDLVIKAYSMQQIADWLEDTLYSLRPFLSVCGPAVREADIDLTTEWPDWKENDWFQNRGR
jgi:hypothetical protein